MENKFQQIQIADKIFQDFFKSECQKFLFVIGDKFSGKTSFLRNKSLEIENSIFANFKDSKLNSPTIVNQIDSKTFLHKSEESLPKLIQGLQEKNNQILFLDCLEIKNQNLNEFFELIDFLHSSQNIKFVISLNTFDSFDKFLEENFEEFNVLKLGLLTKDETKNFVKSNFPSLKHEQLYSLTNGHLFYTKLLCEYFTKNQSDKIIEKDFLKFLESESTSINWIWKRFDVTKKAILFFLYSDTLKIKLIEKVCDEVTALNENLTSNQVLEAISELKTLGLIQENQNELRFTIPFLKNFLLNEITVESLKTDFVKEFKLTKIHLELGLIQFENEDFIDSVENFKKVLDRQPGNFEAKLNLATALKFYPNTLPEIKLYFFENLYNSNSHRTKEIYLKFVNTLDEEKKFVKLQKIANDFPDDINVQKSVLDLTFQKLDSKSLEEISQSLLEKLENSKWILQNFETELNRFLKPLTGKENSKVLIPIFEKILSEYPNDFDTQKLLFSSYSNVWEKEFSSFFFENFTKIVNETKWLKSNFQKEMNDFLNKHFTKSLELQNFDLIVKMYDVIPDFLSPYSFYPFVQEANETSHNKIKKLIEKRKEKGLEKGYKKGFESGKVKGFEKGLDLGEREGYEIGVKEGYQIGFNEGSEKGFDKGMDIGYQKGFQQGRSESRRS